VRSVAGDVTAGRSHWSVARAAACESSAGQSIMLATHTLTQSSSGLHGNHRCSVRHCAESTPWGALSESINAVKKLRCQSPETGETNAGRVKVTLALRYAIDLKLCTQLPKPSLTKGCSKAVFTSTM